MRTVGDVSELAGVTVRTLHHYDEIGLLSPSGRSAAGYRLYSYDDLARLQEIVIWRQLGFSLTERRVSPRRRVLGRNGPGPRNGRCGDSIPL